MNQQLYRKLISGQIDGLPAALFRGLLRTISCFYLAAVALRNLLYSKGWLKIHHVNAAVLSIGNITTGGTGKTPLVVWLSSFLNNNNIPCAILTRGYKTIRDNLSDEPAILAESCPHTAVIVNPDRVAGAAEAIRNHHAKVLIMDDGFQHRRLHRDLDILTIDATSPFGYSRILPAGLLREPLSAVKRAHAAVITRCNQIAQPELTHLENKLRLVNPDMLVAASIHAPVRAVSADNRQISLEELKNKKVFAFCAIGNPDAFLATLRQLGALLIGSGLYHDHHHYSESDIAQICREAASLNADLILTTQKDWTKAAPLLPPEQTAPFAFLAVEIKFITGQDQLTHLIERTLHGKITSDNE